MKKTLLIILLCAFLAACRPDENLNGNVEGEYPEAVERVLEMYILTRSVANPEVEVISYEQVTWKDTCFEVDSSDEVCEEEPTTGWLVILRDGQEEVEVLTDMEGRMRIKW